MAFLQAKVNWTTVSLTTATVRTVGGLKAPAAQVVKVLEFRATHDGAQSGNAPDVTTLDRTSFASNAPGTGSTSYAGAKKDPGRQESIQTSLATSWTVEPTIKTLQEQYNLPQYNGAYHYIFPFAGPEIVPGGGGYTVDHNTPNSPLNSSGKLDFEE